MWEHNGKIASLRDHFTALHGRRKPGEALAKMQREIGGIGLENRGSFPFAGRNGDRTGKGFELQIADADRTFCLKAKRRREREGYEALKALG